MQTKELYTFYKRSDQVNETDQAVILITLDFKGDVNISTFGTPAQLGNLRTKAIKLLQSSIQK